MGRGRPKGYRLSNETRKKIAESKKGQKRDFSTREKIAAGVKKYYDDHFVDKMFANYRMCDPIFEWLKDFMDSDMRGDHTHHLEDCFGDTIELFPSNENPEKWIITQDLQKKLPKHSPILRKLLDKL